MTTTRTCKQRIRAHFKSRMDDIRKLWALERAGNDESDPDLGTFNEYGLAFDYVAPGTFNGQRSGYWRWQLSCGGPSDEIRFFADDSLIPILVEYRFMDWFDGAALRPIGADRQVLLDIWDFWMECELPQAKKREALQQ